MDYKLVILCGVMVVALTTAVTMAAPLSLLQIEALDDLLDDAYRQAMDDIDETRFAKRTSSWNYCRHHVTGTMCKCSSKYYPASRHYFDCEVPAYLNNPWNRITRNW